ncbi:MAG: hypothetical protein H5T69_09885 [Chloroflexi bacterium]|nr:hypothetical protein [Chloroflexota bacterium]
MKVRQFLSLALLLLMALAPLVGVQAQQGAALSAQADPPRDPSVLPDLPGFRVAQPRVGIISPTQGDADNLMVEWNTSPEQPLTTVVAGRRFALRSDYEAVFFPGGNGSAQFELLVYRILNSGERVLIGSKHQLHAGSGPLRIPGMVVVSVSLPTPGVHRLAIVSRSTARPAQGQPVTDEDEIIVHVMVTGTPTPPIEPVAVGTPVPEPVTVARNAAQRAMANRPRPLAAGAPSAGSIEERLVFASSRPEEMPPITVTPMPIPTERELVVAFPRGHLLPGGVGAAENFAQGHGRTLYVRQGDSVTFKTLYEFVWFEGAGGTAYTLLEIRADGLRDSPFVQDSLEEGRQGAWRLAGTLEAELPFPDPGEFRVEARIYTRVSPTGPTPESVLADEDVVRVRVIVLAQPQLGAIAGLVTAEGNEVPLQRVLIRAVDAETGHVARMAYTGEDGCYLISSLPVGRYLVQADPLAQNYLSEWYDNKPTREEADPVEVVANATTADIDFALAPGGVISGQVVEDDPSSPLTVIKPLGGVLVVAGAFDSNVIVAKTRTLRDGSYRLDKLPTGIYWVHAGNASWADSESVEYSPLIGEYWDDHLEREDADPVRVVAGQEVERINFALRYGGTIAGRVLGNGTTPVIVPFKVTAFDWESGAKVRTVLVGPQGYYRIPSLPEGRYRVYAFDEQGYFVPEYYDNVTDPTEATPVVVRRGEVTTGIDFMLDMAGLATLKIEPLITQVQPGETFTVTVEVADAVDLGAFSFEIAFNPEVIEALGVELGDFLGSTGRQVVPVGPEIDNEAGLLAYGAASFGDEQGPNGDGTLAHVRFQAKGVGESPLTLQNVQLTDTHANPLEHLLRNGRVLVGECIFGDFDCDCDVDIADIMQVAVRWGAREGDPDYDPTFDLDDDGDIDIVDLALVAAAWGNTCDEAVASARMRVGAGAPSALSTGLRLEPSSAQGAIGQPLTLEVWVDEAVDLGAFEFTLRYDADKVSVSAGDVALGSFIESTGRSATLMVPQIEVNGAVGTLSVGAFTLGAGLPGPDGSGALAQIRFWPKAAGQAAFELSDAQVTDTAGHSQELLSLQGGNAILTGSGISFLPHIQR